MPLHQAETTVLGIDPGTRITGYGIIQRKGALFTCLDYGTIRPPTKAAPSKRYHTIFHGVSTLISHYAIDALSVETSFVQHNIRSAMMLAMARAAVLIAAEEGQLPIYEYSPTKAKNGVVGSGRASKQQVAEMVRCLLNLDTLPQPEDATDALALALCHLNQLHTIPI